MAECGAQHPERPEIICPMEGSNHPTHMARVIRTGEQVQWTNPSYRPPPTAKTLRDAAEKVRQAKAGLKNFD